MTFKPSHFPLGRLLALLVAMLLACSAFAFSQSEWIVHSFPANGSQGTQPLGNLVADRAGNLYGTTQQGGAFIHGTVYELIKPLPPKTAWTETVLYNFTGGDDGSYPFAGVVFDKMGSLYGTTYVGGAFSEGTVFELSPPAAEGGSWTESVLHSFTNLAGDGSRPLGGVVFDSSGNLYGTTSATVFELTPPAAIGGEWTESVLYIFGRASQAALRQALRF
jgi:uncharacterized repeat protein (TIGR03803 family)